jgi:hypothetical protein
VSIWDLATGSTLFTAALDVLRHGARFEGYCVYEQRGAHMYSTSEEQCVVWSRPANDNEGTLSCVRHMELLNIILFREHV